MAVIKIENLTFTYPKRDNKALNDITLTIGQGEFITICGKSGCGKTTLLRMLKSSLTPFGNLSGNVYFNDSPLETISAREQASAIGFVMQNPDNQIVTDKVWHELAFGLESLGYSTAEIRTRVAEMASFFGIAEWFHKKVTELSGGQKQLLNLASIMVMQPSILILDEPTSQLDPIAAQEFLKTLEKINRELGTTVILTEHRLEDAFPISNRVVVMDSGKIIVDGTPEETGKILKSINHDMYSALPSPMRIYGAVENGSKYPLTVRDGRCWIEKYSEKNPLNEDLIPKSTTKPNTETVIEMRDVWFRYEKNLPDVIKGLNVKIKKGELFAIVGGNGTGKTTALSLISGINTPHRGEILINGEKISKIPNLYNGILGVLPQNPQSLFVKKTVYLDLLEILSERKSSDEEKEMHIKNISALCHIDNLLGFHPYDLSGGEQQRAALAKILLKAPEILLLDEPTKGFDAHFKQIFADILSNLKLKGVTVIMVSHDIEFCAEYADRCALVFDGNITSTGAAREFFAGKSFYTTAANRMARTRLPKAVTPEDVIRACGGNIPQKKASKTTDISLPVNENKRNHKISAGKKLTPKRIICGIFFALLFVILYVLQFSENTPTNDLPVIQLLSIISLAGSVIFFLPAKEFEIDVIRQPKSERRLSKRSLTASLLILLAIPLTIFIGMFCLEDKKYYFISLLIILETMIPFCMVFESRKPQARELIIISVMCAIAVAGRAAFYMLPQFKPVAALVIITGICFGAEAGFLVGAISGFVSNFFFGQGPWTPWQMFAFGIIGFIAGILFKKGMLRRTKASLCIFGFLATFIIYGGIINPASLLMWQSNPTFEMLISSYVMGAPFDLIHAASTAFFLWFISEAMIDKLERIKVKYGLIDKQL